MPAHALLSPPACSPFPAGTAMFCCWPPRALADAPLINTLTCARLSPHSSEPASPQLAPTSFSVRRLAPIPTCVGRAAPPAIRKTPCTPAYQLGAWAHPSANVQTRLVLAIDRLSLSRSQWVREPVTGGWSLHIYTHRSISSV